MHCIPARRTQQRLPSIAIEHEISRRTARMNVLAQRFMERFCELLEQRVSTLAGTTETEAEAKLRSQTPVVSPGHSLVVV
jgi:hypothetical protein